ncbi:MAG: hypothetical protein DRN54_03385 [Thaumarchaeota archaeon]|nr:MAG: hypothetical protein DRN54_03385 [Nitrososphaerota archaeon]
MNLCRLQRREKEAERQLRRALACSEFEDAVDQIDNETWVLECKCGSKNCRKKVTGNLFKLPKKIQREKLPYLPTWVKRKYRDRIRKLGENC